MKVQVANARKSTLREAPHWDARSSTLLHVDCLERKIIRYDPDTGTETVVFRTEEDLGVAIPYAENNRKLVAGVGNDVCVLDLDTNEKALLTQMLDLESSVPTRINDGKCDALGRLWAGTMSRMGMLNLVPEKSNFWSYSKGQLKHKLDKVSLSNGIAWTSDNQTMFYSDSVPGMVYAFDFDLTAGDISNRRVLADFRSTPGYQELALPDGMITDLNNKIWMACFAGSSVVQIDPETAKILTKISFPAKFTTSCCFGGANYDVLYVTTGDFGLKTTRPEDGMLFKVTDLGVKGQPAYEFAG